MQHEVLIERFFTALISGDRTASRAIVDEVLDADCPADAIINKLMWPTLEHIHTLHRADQLSNIAHNYATRLLRNFVEQMQMRLEQKQRRNKNVLLVSGPEEPEEISGLIAADLLEADGYNVMFAGGGIANDEIIEQVGELNIDVLVVFGAAASTVPFTRVLIDKLRDIGVCPNMQIAVGGGVFNRAEGLAEEIGADVWATTPDELVSELDEKSDRRMTADQRTVGRRRRTKAQHAA
jgi:methanogenic corrinoid protein MtbC1